MADEFQEYKVKDPTGSIRTIRGPAGASNEQVIAQAKKLFGSAPAATPAAPAAPEPSALEQAGGAAKHLGTGIYKGLTGLAGLPGDVQQMAQTGAQKVIEATTGAQVPNLPTLGPTTEKIRGNIDHFTGGPEKPSTVLEEWMETVGEFLPASLGGEASIPARIARVLFPATASEAAGQVTRQVLPEAEGVARMAGSLTPQTVTWLAQARPDRMLDSIKTLFDEAGKRYQHKDVKDVIIRTPVAQQTAMEIADDLLKTRGMNVTNSPGTTDALRYMLFQPSTDPLFGTSAKMGPKPGVNIDDIQAVRSQLNATAQVFEKPMDQSNAILALKKIDDWLATGLAPNKLMRGDATKAAAILGDARGDYWAAMSLKMLSDKLYSAHLRAGSTYSGTNFDNVLRQNVRSILDNPKRAGRYTPKEKELMEKIITGTAPENLLRRISKALPRSGPMGALIHGAAVGQFGLKGMALAAVGSAAAGAENRIANKLIRDLQETILERAPSVEQNIYKIPERPRKDFATPAILGSEPARTMRFDERGNVIQEPEKHSFLEQFNPIGSAQAMERKNPYEQVIGGRVRGGEGGAGGRTSVRSQKSLERAIQEADSDEELIRIKRLLEKRGYDTSAIPALRDVP